MKSNLIVFSLVFVSLGSKAALTIYLPEMSDETTTSASYEDEVTCTTHTGSTLSISPETQTVKIDIKAGEQLNYMIVTTDVLKLESIPAQVQSTFLIDDGRKVVTTFAKDSLTGRGHYIRIGGGASPSFECSKE